MQFLRLPFFDEIREAKNILVAGAGGGFDLFCGLPLYFGLRAAGAQVHLANLSFSELRDSTARPMGPALFEVTADTDRVRSYFPELYLSRWFREQGEEVPIYGFEQTGVRPLLASYRALVERLAVDTILLVDGGTDSLMRGDEEGLGTPHEDIASIAAVDQLDIGTKLLVCLGFGIDTFHGVCHAHFLEAVADLTRSGAFLGAWSLTPEMPEVQRYREATLAVFNAMPHEPSIVSASILSAIEGRFGDYHMTGRTSGSQLFINSLMTLYWCFRLAPVAERVQYLEAMRKTETYWVRGARSSSSSRQVCRKRVGGRACLCEAFRRSGDQDRCGQGPTANAKARKRRRKRNRMSAALRVFAGRVGFPRRSRRCSEEGFHPFRAFAFSSELPANLNA